MHPERKTCLRGCVLGLNITTATWITTCCLTILLCEKIMIVATKDVKEIVHKVFPNFKGRDVTVQPFRGPYNLNSYWDGGCRRWYAFYDLITKREWHVPDSHPFFDRRPDGSRMGAIQCKELPENTVLVVLSYTYPKYRCTIYGELSPSLPEPESVDDDERIVLEYTRSYKNTYAGRTNVRFWEAHHSTGISQDRWESAKARLIERRLLRKNGSLTREGRNVID